MPTYTIVLLDRDPEVSRTIRTMLATARHEVIEAASPADALTALSKRQVDVVLTNRVLGTFAGEASLLEMIRAVQPRTAIVLTTRWDGALDNPLPFDAILPKPFSLPDLNEIVAGVTRRR